MNEIEVRYIKGDRFLTYVRDHEFLVDQPVADGGDDVGPTPLELFVTSLAACVGFYAERFLARHRLPGEGLRVSARYEMSEDLPARVGSIEVATTLPEGFPPDRMEAIMRVIEHCTVHNSLRQPPEVRLTTRVREVAD